LFFFFPVYVSYFRLPRDIRARLLLPLFQIIRCSGFSIYIAFTMYLDIIDI